MLVIKVTILMWVLNFILKWWVKNTVTKEDLMDYKLYGEIRRFTFSRIAYVITLCLGLVGIMASAVWALFLR